MNNYLSGVIELLIMLNIWMLITLFIFICRLLKSLKLITIDIDYLNFNLDVIKQKLNEIEETKDSWKMVLSLYLIASVFKATKKDYKKSKSKDKTYLKSFVKACVTNISTIKKIQTI